MPKELTKDVENKLSDEISKELKTIEEIEQKIKKLKNDTNEKFANSNTIAFAKISKDSGGILKSVSEGRLDKN